MTITIFICNKCGHKWPSKQSSPKRCPPPKGCNTPLWDGSTDKREQYKVPKQFWQEIQHFPRIIIPVSGGKDSTVIMNHFMNRHIDFELLWNNTGRALKSAREILCHIFRTTGKSFYITVPVDDQSMITKKTKAAMAQIVSGKKKYNKKSIPCCWYLKEKPALRFLKDHTDEDTLIISGIAGSEGFQRQFFLSQLRKRKTFLHYHTSKNRWYAYPFRDVTSKAKAKKTVVSLSRTIFADTKKSGCHSCPIVALFEEATIENMQRVNRSKKVYLPSSAQQ